MTEEAEIDFSKLSIEDRCQHKAWKARISGYEAASNLFLTLTDDKSPEFSKYLGLVKKFVVDSNVIAQEKGLSAALAYIENAACAPKTCGEVMSGIVTKCLSSTKAKTRELASEIILIYIEIEKPEAVQEELIKGLANKNPKIMAACVVSLRNSLSCFGPKVINIKPLLKLLGKLLEDRDKTVREETKQLTVEIYRWIGDALKPQLQSLKPVQLSELESEFAKVADDKPRPTRYLRSQQPKQDKQPGASEVGGDEGKEMAEAGNQEYIDPYEFIEAVDVLSKLPKNFYEQCENKKWSERKDALEALLQLITSPKIEPGDFGDVVKTLKKIVAKDINIVVVALAGKCLAGLATGLRKKFQPYAKDCISVILEKFKEKKPAVVTALREAIDAIYKTTTLEVIMEEIQTVISNKNPQIRMETTNSLARYLSQCTPTILTKKMLKGLCVLLVKPLNDSDAQVRDASAEALGTAWKVAGERMISPFLADLDPIKMAKIKDCADKATSSNTTNEQKPNEPKPAERPKSAANEANKAASSSAASKPAKPKSAPARVTKNTTGAKKVPPEAPKAFRITEKDLTEEDIEALLSDKVPAEVISGLSSGDWKERLAAVEKFSEIVAAQDNEAAPTQALVKLLTRKPGFKENNFQVMNLKLELLIAIVDKINISQFTVDACLSDLTEKIGDPKTGPTVGSALTALAEASNLGYIGQEVLQLAFSKKNPKNQVEVLNWLSNAIKEFGLVMPIKVLIDCLKNVFSTGKPNVKTSGLTLLGTLYLYIGNSARTFFDDEKPALLQQIDQELAKHENEKPPAPTRGLQSSSKQQVDPNRGASKQTSQNTCSIQDLLPRKDISEQITSALVTELGDKIWTTRAEALQKVLAIIGEAKFIQPNIGGLPEALRPRLADSNKNLVVQTLNVFQMLANALGPSSTKHLRNVAPALLLALGDSKPHVRAATLKTLNTWLEHCGLAAMFEGEMIAEALRNDSPNLKIELLGWLAEKLPQAKATPNNADLAACFGPIFNNLEDRNVDVRKKTQEVLLPLMNLVSYESISRAAGKLKPASKISIMAQLEKLRPNITPKPARAPVKSKSSPSESTEDVSNEKGTAGEDVGKAKSKGGPSKVKMSIRPKSSSVATTKKEDKVEEAISPFITNSLKGQRISDEKSLKALRWNFTAPREEHIVQLKDQMTAGAWSSALIADCFHCDFKFHIKAIDVFAENITLNGDATVSNLDLILKWLAIRFFDTNPSVLIKSLEYLQQLFGSLAEAEYRLLEAEASSFLPYLIVKMGDPKEPVRKGVREILKLSRRIYSLPKLFQQIMQGLASKNARQRAECLEELSSMIETCGINTLCQPSVALKEIAKQIADRDNSVRNAALNCLVQAFNTEGEKVYKLVGRLTEKEMSLLEERIKRSSKPKPPSTPILPTEELSKTLVTPPNDASHSQATPKQSVFSSKKRPVSETPTSRPKPTGPFSLDWDEIENQFKDKELPESKLPVLIDIAADEILNLPDIQLPVTRHRPSPASAFQFVGGSSELTTAQNLVFSQLAAQNIAVAVQSFAHIIDVLKSDSNVLESRIDQLLVIASLQYRLGHTKHMSDDTISKADVIKLYRSVTLTLFNLFGNTDLARKASRDVLRDLISNLISVMMDSRLTDLQEGPQIVRAINHLVKRMLQHSNPTCVMSALIKMLHDSVSNEKASERYTDIVMKCLWSMLQKTTMDAIINELNVDRILLDIHIFFKSYPPSFWRAGSDVSLRTIKTILFTLVKYKKIEIFEHLALIPNLKESNMESYLQKLLKTNKDNPLQPTLPASERKPKKVRRLSAKTTSDASLAEIFKKIGSKDFTKEGLQELYHYRRDNPEADIEPFLQISSEFFQDYILKGLKDIEKKSLESLSPEIQTPCIPQVPTPSLSNIYSLDETIIPAFPHNPIEAPCLDWAEWLKSTSAVLGVASTHKFDDSIFQEKFKSTCAVNGQGDITSEEIEQLDTIVKEVEYMSADFKLKFNCQDARRL